MSIFCIALPMGGMRRRDITTFININKPKQKQLQDLVMSFVLRFTYEVAPVFTLMEAVVLERMRHIVGWKDGDGIFSPGGAISNLYGVLTARHYACPDIKQKGLLGKKQLVLFTSEQSHFSILRAASILGIGTDNLVKISCDHRGKMKVAELEEKIIAAKIGGKLPFFVNATCGTTILGAFDPVNDIADVCERHKVWLHVDGAWGGSVLMSKKHRHLLNGIERANSLTWNPHKLLGVPLQCSAFLLREKGIMQQSNEMHADYLFQKDKNYEVIYDTGDKTIQCGRHNDIFKFWLMWRAKGEKGFEAHINRMFELGNYLRELIRKREGFKFVLEKGECTNVCFWYVPLRIREMDDDERKKSELHQATRCIKAMMMENGSLMVGYQPLGEHPNFFRVVISNAAVMEKDLDFLVEEIDRLGRTL
ncbi:glutamate decarboxylase 1-like [Octopus vulgaris]|uniref:Glutamate decarboxylase 1-like n=1 Tax=Octopus vulgaris TaxID=6645 RepID=A0AA36FF78_OCTVU|nr:glutamate decarboxylase 1-like [Octopus vulgaris]